MKSYGDDLPNIGKAELEKQTQQTQRTIEQNEELKGQNEILQSKLIDLAERSNKLRTHIVIGLALILVSSLTTLGFVIYGSQ